MVQEERLVTNDSAGEAKRLAYLGHDYRANGEPGKALKYYQAALDIYRELGDRPGECEILGNIGLAYTAKGDVEKALEYGKAALELERDIEIG